MPPEFRFREKVLPVPETGCYLAAVPVPAFASASSSVSTNSILNTSAERRRRAPSGDLRAGAFAVGVDV